MIKYIIQELEKNGKLFAILLSNTSEESYLWKPSLENWCLLEVICHLVDEEQEDFRVRVKHVLETPELSLAPFDPTKWVAERQYMKQNFDERLQQFLYERKKSIEWLRSLETPNWEQHNFHPKAGSRTAKMFLANWLAHDHIHFRQINRLKFGYLEAVSKEDLSYAGRSVLA